MERAVEAAPVNAGDILDPRDPVPTAPALRPPLLKALTSIRYLAALHVALFHFLSANQHLDIFAGFVRAGFTGVSFFFVLSGFILTYSHAAEYEQGRQSANRFYFARFARIYPVYLVSLIVAGVISYRLFAQPIHIIAFVADLLMVQSWSIRTSIFFLIPGWTLSFEAFFYLIFPLLVLRLRPRLRWQALTLLAGLWLASMAVPMAYLLHTYGSAVARWAPSDGAMLAFRIERNILLAVPEFMAGMVLGWTLVRFPPTRRQSMVLAVLGIVSTLAVLLYAAHLPYLLIHNGLLIPCYAALILGLSKDHAISRFLSFAPLILLGEASYAFYLDHYFLKDVFPEPTFLAAAIKIVMMTGIAIGVHLLVERPARIWLLQWKRSRA